MKRKPTSRQRVLQTIRQFWRAYHYPPTMKDIMHRLNFNSIEAVRYHLRALREQGVIEWTEGATRTIRIKETP